jgi:hypothetical protein
MVEAERATVLAALNGLGTDDRLVIALRHFEELSEAEMAIVLDCPAGTVKPRRLLAAAVLVVALLATALAIAPVRHAVAGWLGIGSTTVERGEPSPAPLPGFLVGMQPVDAAEAARRLGRPLPVVTALGPPDGVYAAPEGGVVLAWADGQVSLWVHRDADAPFLLKKIASVATDVEVVSGPGDQALWVGGPHVFESPVRHVQADSVLLWIQGIDEYRLEGDRSRDGLVAIARSVSG